MPTWLGALNDTYVGSEELELVVRTIPTVGNYDYVLDWVLTQAGEIRVDVGATGYPAVKGVVTRAATSPSSESDLAYGGVKALKNIARPVRAFRVNWTDSSTTSATGR